MHARVWGQTFFGTASTNMVFVVLTALIVLEAKSTLPNSVFKIEYSYTKYIVVFTCTRYSIDNQKNISRSKDSN